MKKILTLCMAVAISIPLVAQDLTKEETVSYINKKVKECEGRTRRPAADAPLMYYKSLSFYLNSDGTVTFSVASSNYASYTAKGDYIERYTKSTFNPLHIVSITEDKNDSNKTVASFTVKLIGRTGKWEQTAKAHLDRYDVMNERLKIVESANQNESRSEAQFLYLKTDPTSFNKLKNALEYLRDLCKAEEEFDPFG